MARRRKRVMERNAFDDAMLRQGLRNASTSPPGANHVSKQFEVLPVNQPPQPVGKTT